MVRSSADVNWLEQIARDNIPQELRPGTGRLASSPKDLRSAAYMRLGELAGPEAIAAIHRIESAAKGRSLFAPLPLTMWAHPGWHFSDWRPHIITSARAADGTTYAVLLGPLFGDIDLLLISSRTPEDPTSWSRPHLLPHHFAGQIRRAQVTIAGDKVAFDYELQEPGPRNIMDPHVIDPPAPPVVAGPQQATFSLRDVLRDSDGDGWTDLEEERLGLNPHDADTDHDGLADGADPCPNLALKDALKGEDAQILERAVFAVFGIGGSPMLMEAAATAPKIHAWGLAAPLLYDVAERWHKEHPNGLIQVSWKITEKTADEATVEIVDYEAPLAAGSQTVRLRRINGEWLVIGRRTGWVS